MATKSKMHIESNFLKAAAAGREATAFAVEQAVKEGKRKAAERIDSAAGRRGYNLSGSAVKSEWHGLDGGIGVEEFWWRFFEYGTLHMAAMPFLRPGHRAMRKSFIEWMGVDFEGWISRRAKVRRV